MSHAKDSTTDRALLDFAACRALSEAQRVRMQRVLLDAVLDGDSTHDACAKAGIRPSACLLMLETDEVFARQLQWATQRRSYWLEDAIYQTARKGSVTAQRMALQKLKPELWGEEDGDNEARSVGYQVRHATPSVVEQLCRQADAAIDQALRQHERDEFGEITSRKEDPAQYGGDDDYNYVEDPRSEEGNTADSGEEDRQSEQRSSEDNIKSEYVYYDDPVGIPPEEAAMQRGAQTTANPAAATDNDATAADVAKLHAREEFHKQLDNLLAQPARVNDAADTTNPPSSASARTTIKNPP